MDLKRIKLFAFLLAAAFVFSPFFAQAQGTNYKKSNPENIVVTGKFYDYTIVGSSEESIDMPTAKINMYNQSGIVVGSLSFFKKTDLLKKAKSKVEVQEGKYKIYNVSYEYDLFDHFLTMLENGKNLNIEYNPKKKEVFVKTNITRPVSDQKISRSNTNKNSNSVQTKGMKGMKKGDVVKMRR